MTDQTPVAHTSGRGPEPRTPVADLEGLVIVARGQHWKWLRFEVSPKGVFICRWASLCRACLTPIFTTTPLPRPSLRRDFWAARAAKLAAIDQMLDAAERRRARAALTVTIHLDGSRRMGNLEKRNCAADKFSRRNARAELLV